MKTKLLWILPLLLAPCALGAGWLDFLGLGRKPVSTNAPAGLLGSALSQEQMAGGLKAALARGVEQAVAALGKPNGFLTNLNVRIPVPESMQRVEKTLRSLKQDKLADDFITTMNRAAEQAVPQGAAILGGAIQQMTLADAHGILTGGTNAATQYFRRTSETNLYERFYPIDPPNRREALREVQADIEEGADMVMVKPALAYLDIIREVRDTFPTPLAAYNVSGEYSMVKAAALNGWVDERRIVLELLTGIKRAGADIIISYHTPELAEWGIS